ncbi:hypothetical protein [Burkholderia sp. Nafp2/4-1b]|uniref:hypothetical protein n=1 Tax=Burkholderia sp. Nafp2/4-1b TaxID=2116686 RepID=UPI0013CEA337|nr:hypothetical protein [Burkholderia sp. Nafp2/4-1b]
MEVDIGGRVRARCAAHRGNTRASAIPPHRRQHRISRERVVQTPDGRASARPAGRRSCFILEGDDAVRPPKLTHAPPHRQR